MDDDKFLECQRGRIVRAVRTDMMVAGHERQRLVRPIDLGLDSNEKRDLKRVGSAAAIETNLLNSVAVDLKLVRGELVLGHVDLHELTFLVRTPRVGEHRAGRDPARLFRAELFHVECHVRVVVDHVELHRRALILDKPSRCRNQNEIRHKFSVVIESKKSRSSKKQFGSCVVDRKNSMIST